jgi:hypothetical protein
MVPRRVLHPLLLALLALLAYAPALARPLPVTAAGQTFTVTGPLTAPMRPRGMGAVRPGSGAARCARRCRKPPSNPPAAQS